MRGREDASKREREREREKDRQSERQTEGLGEKDILKSRDCQTERV